MIVHEAAATIVDLYHALIAWLTVLAVAASMIAGAAVACFAPGTRVARRDAAAPSWRRGRARVRRPSSRIRPPWSHEQPTRYEEAA